MKNQGNGLMRTFCVLALGQFAVCNACMLGEAGLIAVAPDQI